MYVLVHMCTYYTVLRGLWAPVADDLVGGRGQSRGSRRRASWPVRVDSRNDEK
jgi:hypothetical protein